MWSLEAELAKFAKSKAFKAAAAQAVKDDRDFPPDKFK